MRDSIRTGPVVQREWFEDSMERIEHSFELYRSGKLPDTIEAFMVVTPIKHALRAISGKDNRGAAWQLLKEAWFDYAGQLWCEFRYRIGWLNQDMKDAQEDMDNFEDTPLP